MAQYSAALRRAMLATANTVLGSGARFVLYSGSVPDYADAPLSDAPLSDDNNELASLAMSSTAFGFPSGDPGQDVTALANNLLADTDAANTGRATFFRILDGDGTPHVQGTIGINGTDNDLTLNSADIQIHAAVSVTGPALVFSA